MQLFRADLHIHTVLSPCGSLEMSPERIVNEAIARGLHIIAITDHNSTRQCRAVMEAGQEKGLFVIGGAEISTREEVHCVTLFEDIATLEQFQTYIDRYLPNIPNNPDKFGYQIWVNRDEEIEGEEPRFLLSGLEQSIDDVEQMVHSLNGLFIPAHIDRPSFSLFSQLGFFPPALVCNAVEISGNATQVFIDSAGIKGKYRILSSSDAHYPNQIGSRFTTFEMREATFEEVRKQLRIKREINIEL
ncbi:MAG: PHP domain-containing protein [Cytophagaceae bacterium]|jgi:PHP family Zn ribbon phosphoesterase|nr:PHP domain-containing protein [Cytophagaceae bacterium]